MAAYTGLGAARPIIKYRFTSLKRMHIGIAVKIEHSLFSSGANNAALAIAEMCETLGHKVILVNTAINPTNWWIDGVAIKTRWEGRIKSINSIGARLDILFEIDAQELTAASRAAAAARCIWIVRHSPLIHETENAIFPIVSVGYMTEGLTEVWMWDINTTEDDCQIMETIVRVPCRRVPFLWTPMINTIFEKIYNIRPWLQTTAEDLLKKNGKVGQWKLHIAESNKGSYSSCVLPLFIARESGETTWTVHNSHNVDRSDFFRHNVVKNACTPLTAGVTPDISGVFVGRHRAIDWALEPMSYVISHVRFERLRPYLLDLIWFGIPVVHNSPALADLSGGLYYSGNEISGACRALEKMKADFIQMAGIFKRDSLLEGRKKIIELFSPAGAGVQVGWRAALLASPEAPPVRTLKIRFCDMWESFNPDYNFFTLLLKDAVGEKVVIQTEFSGAPDLVIFGPFGSEWRKYPEVPKVFYTGENIPSVMDPSVRLNLTFEHLAEPDDGAVRKNQIRFPLWMMEIDWFGADLERIHNPKPIPLADCTTVRASDLARKKKFCAFVVSNPKNEIRNAAFHWLTQWRQVDSAGALFRNVDQLAASAAGASGAGAAPICGGGGGGELAKVEFLRDYKFCLVFENASAPGYTTEKLLHAKAAGCIPIYWGDPEVHRDFDLDGIIDARHIKSAKELIHLVREVDENDSEWLRRFSVPALNSRKVVEVRRIMSDIARRILEIVGLGGGPLPTFLGREPPPPKQANGSDSVPAEISVVANATGPHMRVPTPNPAQALAVSYTSKKFLHCVPIWLKSILSQPHLKARIYLASDIPAASEAELRAVFPTVDFRHIPITPPEGAWPDYWAPEHFAWKLWILAEVASAEPAGEQVLYMDIATFISRWPTTWMARAAESGIYFLEDKTQINRNWCHDVFVTALGVTPAELAGYQIWAGAIAFMTGAPSAVAVLSEAFEVSKRREVITGPKWVTVTTGHRHDQSILSILSSRAGAARIGYESVVGTTSLRRTFQSGLAIYAHRGDFKLHVQPYKGIDEVFVVSLARRADRLERFKEGGIAAGVVDAVDGRALTLTPALTRLLAPNDFGWKKSVAGCALSHLGLWVRLLKDNPDIQTYLILEDDMVFGADWSARWAAAQPHLPADADIVYLGGILPPNRAGFEAKKEPVNAWWNRMGENSLFGQMKPNRYMHSCTYAYMITRRGAAKVLELIIERGGIWTSADHMLCNEVGRLNIYFSEPLLAKCYQEEDPKYLVADFNNYARVDQFDSDIWNNDERFQPGPIDHALDIEKALLDARRSEQGPKFVCTTKSNIRAEIQTEMAWLCHLFGVKGLAEVKPTTRIEEGDILITLTDFTEVVTMLTDAVEHGIKCTLIVLADEYCTFPMDFYGMSSVKRVIRTYPRLTPYPEKVTTIPLGFYRRPAAGAHIPPLSERTLDWSFMGTDWKDRGSIIKICKIPELKWECRMFDEWNDPAQVGETEYVATMLNSKFVLCPSGHNGETFRFYEAIECGAIPLIVGEPKNEPFLAFIKNRIPVIPIKSWEDAKEFMLELRKTPELMDGYRQHILDGWAKWKVALADEIHAMH